MATAAANDQLLTAEEYGRLPDNGRPTELVRGRIVEMNVPYPRHGEVCGKTTYFLWQYLSQNNIGRVLTNDAGVRTERSPDTMRGMDVGFLSYERRPRGPLPRDSYIDEVPELIFEIRSPTDRWANVLAKVAELLRAGVLRVVVLDEQTHTARVYSPDEPEHVLGVDDVLTLPEILPGFSVRVGEFFE